MGDEEMTACATAYTITSPRLASRYYTNHTHTHNTNPGPLGRKEGKYGAQVPRGRPRPVDGHGDRQLRLWGVCHLAGPDGGVGALGLRGGCVYKSHTGGWRWAVCVCAVLCVCVCVPRFFRGVLWTENRWAVCVSVCRVYGVLQVSREDWDVNDGLCATYLSPFLPHPPSTSTHPSLFAHKLAHTTHSPPETLTHPRDNQESPRGTQPPSQNTSQAKTKEFLGIVLDGGVSAPWICAMVCVSGLGEHRKEGAERFVNGVTCFD